MRPSLSNYASRLVCTASLCLAAFAGSAVAQESTAGTQGSVQRPQANLSLSVSKGTLIRLDRPAASVFIADPKIADVQVRSPQLIYVLGVSPGETTLYAMDHGDRAIYAATVHVSNNIEQVRNLLKAAMPNTEISVEPFNSMVMLSGVVPSPEAVGEAERLVKQLLGNNQVVINKLRTATPVQVNLQVKIAEVSRSLLKEVGFNIATRDMTGGFLFNLSRGRRFVNIRNADISALPKVEIAPGVSLPYDAFKGQFINPLRPGTVFEFLNPDGASSIGMAGRLFGLDAAAAIDALAEEGLVTVLAEPNLTSISGEMASFLAGGEFAIPMPAEDGRVLIEYKEFGVGLSFTPHVLSDDRIALRVRPEVSELSQAGSITVNGISVPGLTTRRAETTVELGSGQSFMIAGLLRNTTGHDATKIPVLGDLPILGTLFKSDRFTRNETELVIVVTPYLVKPTDAKNIKLPTDGYRAPSDLQRWLFGKNFAKPNNQATPSSAVSSQPIPATATPAAGPAQPAAAPASSGATSAVTAPVSAGSLQTAEARPTPGFSFQGDNQ